MPIAFPLLSALVSLLAAIPPGPVNFEIMRRVLNRNPASAWAFSAGAAVADGLWPLAAFLGLAPFLRIRWVAVTFWSLAAVVLIYLGLNFIREARTALPEPSALPRYYYKRLSVVAGFSLVLANPGNFATWMAVIGIYQREGFLPAYSFLSGFVLWISAAAGTFAYFSFFILIAARYQKDFMVPKRLRFIKYLFGCLILLMACYFIYNVFRAPSSS